MDYCFFFFFFSLTCPSSSFKALMWLNWLSTRRTLNWRLVVPPTPMLLVTGFFSYLGRKSSSTLNIQPSPHSPSIREVQHSHDAVCIQKCRQDRISKLFYFTPPRSEELSVFITSLLLSLFSNYFLLRLLFEKKKLSRQKVCVSLLI